MNSKKAMMFTTDALIAISLMAIAAAIIFSQDTTRIPYQYTFDQASVISEDSLRILSSIEFSSVNETLKEAIIADTNITTAEYDKNLIYIIGALWAENSATSISYARQLTQTYIGALIPAGYSYGLFIDDNEIYSDPLGLTHKGSIYKSLNKQHTFKRYSKIHIFRRVCRRRKYHKNI